MTRLASYADFVESHLRADFDLSSDWQLEKAVWLLDFFLREYIAMTSNIQGGSEEFEMLKKESELLSNMEGEIKSW